MKRYLLIGLTIVPLAIGQWALSGDIGPSLADDILRTLDFALSSTDMDTLNATPISIVQAPGTGKYNIIDRVTCFNDFNSTSFNLGMGTLDFRYSNSSGSLLARVPGACLGVSSDAYCAVYGQDAMSIANAAIVAHASEDVTAGNGTLRCRVYYKTITASDI